MPLFSGTFSYKNDDVYRRSIGSGLQLVIESMDANIAQIRFESEAEVDGSHVPSDIPANITVVLAGTGAPAARSGNQYFIITWISNYYVLRDGEALFKIFNQQSQAIQPM